MVKIKKDARNKIIIACVVFIAMLFCQTNSPLYQFNSYSDLAIYTVIGRALRNGQVLYRDVFDHKGPIFFFLQTIIYYNKYTVWIHDIVTYAVSGIFLYKQIRLFKNELGSLAGTLFVIGCEISFMWDAGSPEQAFMMLVYISMYLILKDDNDSKTWFIFGIIVGYIFYSKINVLLGWLPWFIYLQIKQIKQKRFLKNLVQATIPFAVMTVIVFAYFAVNDQMNYFIDSYFLQNVGYAENTQKAFSTETSLAFIVLTLVVYFISQRKQEKNIKVLMIAIGMICIHIGETALSGHVYPYYFILMLPFLQIIFMSKDTNERNTLYLAVQILSLSLYGIAQMQMIQNNQLQFMQPIENDVRYKFVEDLKADGEKLDDSFGGVMSLYVIDPNLAYYIPYNPIKYSIFCNMSYDAYPEMYEYAYDMIKDGKVKYVGVRVAPETGNLVTGMMLPEFPSIVDDTLDILRSDSYELYNKYTVGYSDVDLWVYKYVGDNS